MFTSGVGESVIVANISGRDIDTFVGQRSQQSKPATVAKHVRALRRSFRWAQQRRYAERSPLEQATALPSNTIARARPHISDEQLARLVNTVDQEVRRIAIWLAITSGLGRGVIEALTATQVDFEQGIIRFRRPKTQRLGSVPVRASLLPVLAARRDQTAPGLPLLRGLSRQGRKRDWWIVATERAGISGFLFRDLRAIAVTRLMRAPGMSLAQAQRLLGHATPETTARHYLVPDPAAAQALSAQQLPGRQEELRPTKD